MNRNYSEYFKDLILAYKNGVFETKINELLENENEDKEKLCRQLSSLCGVDLGYTRRTCYLSDGTTTTDPAADASIVMNTDYYCNIWNRGSGTCASPNPADNYRLQIIKTLPTTIKSDKIPSSSLTGIGVINNTEATNSYNHYANIALEWFIKTKQALQIKRS